MMTQIIYNSFKAIIIYITNFWLSKKFNSIKTQTILKDYEQVNITRLFNIMSDYYNDVYKDKGLVGVYRYSKSIKKDIAKLT